MVDSDDASACRTPWWPSVGLLTLAVAALWELSLHGTTTAGYVIHHSLLVRAVLLATAAGAAGFAVVLRFVPWDPCSVVATLVAGVAAATVGGYLLSGPVGRGPGGLALVTGAFLAVSAAVERYGTEDVAKTP